MKNKKFLVGALVAIALAVVGVVAYGAGSNQQASVGNLANKTAATSSTVYIAEIPTATYPGLEKEIKTFQASIAALEKKISTTIPNTSGEKRKLILLGNGWCANTGPFGGTVHIVYCGL